MAASVVAMRAVGVQDDGDDGHAYGHDVVHVEEACRMSTMMSIPTTSVLQNDEAAIHE